MNFSINVLTNKSLRTLTCKRSKKFPSTCVIVCMWCMCLCANWEFNVKTLLDHVQTIHESLKKRIIVIQMYVKDIRTNVVE